MSQNKENKNKLNKVANPINTDAPWKQIANWNKKHEHALEDFMIIALRIKSTLKKNNKTQEQLAKDLQVSPQALTRIMKGKQNLTISKIRQIERALNISILSIKKTNHSQSQIRTELIPVEVHYNHSISSFNGLVKTNQPEIEKMQYKKSVVQLSIAS